MSVASESSSYDQALALVAELPFADKLRFNADLAALLKKEGKTGAVGKAAKKEKKAANPDAPKKAAPLGTRAWFAFVKHCKAVFADRFTDCKTEPERLTVCKAIREEDEAVYLEFVGQFKAENAEESSSPAAAPAAPVLTAAQKLEKLKAAKAAADKKPALAAGGGAAAKKPAAEKKPGAAEKPKKEVKKAAAPKKAAEPAKTAAAAEEDAPMPKKEIDGTEYWFDPETNGLYAVEDGGFGAWVGFFQPENDDEPIRFTESPADE
jgi:hypothetical protein